jgi:Tfp pilus assembly protein PilE
VLIPLIIVSLILLIAIAVWHQRSKAKRRRDGLFRLLDLADDMERLLNLSQQRMQAMQAVVGRVPSDIGAIANAALDSSEKIKAVKRDLLQHRLWIQQHSDTASQLEIDDACTALARSRDRIAQQLEALENAGADLVQATANTEQAAEREPASLRRSE